jgi:hypothetical protein
MLLTKSYAHYIKNWRNKMDEYLHYPKAAEFLSNYMMTHYGREPKDIAIDFENFVHDIRRLPEEKKTIKDKIAIFFADMELGSNRSLSFPRLTNFFCSIPFWPAFTTTTSALVNGSLPDPETLTYCGLVATGGLATLTYASHILATHGKKHLVKRKLSLLEEAL